MAIVVGFKRFSGDATQNFDAVSVAQDFLLDQTIYSLVDFTRQKEIHAKYKRWSVLFALLIESGQDYLLDLTGREAPQFVFETVTYNMDVESLNANFRDGTISVINRAPE